MGTLWDDRQHHRDQALARSKPAARHSRSLSRPAPAEGAGQPLARAISPVYYRTKAAYILWMLRDLVGDDALATALRASNAAEPAKIDSAHTPVTGLVSGALKTAGPRNTSIGSLPTGSMPTTASPT